MASVLIVDDEEAIRRLMRDALEQAGYQVQEAADGKQGLACYRQSPADLVIMDILMPDQDGLESILTLRREFPNARIMAITGGSDMIGILNFLDVARMLGARRTLQKPFDMKQLLEAVRTEITG
ncbi:response regulator [Nitrospirales bacterium NOB]|nr:MAG: signal transduction response regulator, receiver domain [Nitrospira sp. OLB3]MBV6469014.1 Chemotaxis protein CheY [Nitrospirota bacterium]MCE7966392.1 response regulator [Nitrospira sp. NTP2]MDL1889947.1 response regulator [Nitrospirales bacterium NOB]MEB2338152.1 response regulator [Nitrospirales bacterium]QOJ35295.1 MAG: response regulator [Nitrospira sp.]